MKGIRILLCVTGGIAAFKAVLVLRLLQKAGAIVRVAMTPTATRFVGPLTFEALSQSAVYIDPFDGKGEGGENHISLAAWAQLILVVPATANTLARYAHGFADNLVTSILLAARSKVVVVPAMHSSMWTHPATGENLATLTRRGVIILEPSSGDLASGAGIGRMMEPEQIVSRLRDLLTPKDLEGVRLLVTAGPTREAFDPVRFISNHSSGKMGYAIARVARLRGACVVLVSGPTALEPPEGVECVNVTSAREMEEAVQARKATHDVIVMAAAVADYTPLTVASSKLKKKGKTTTLTLGLTTDILASLGKWRKESSLERPVLVGFAMETENLLAQASGKLSAKGCDMIVANNLTEPGAGFGHDTNRVTLLFKDGTSEALPLLTKEEVAATILDRAHRLFLEAQPKGATT